MNKILIIFLTFGIFSNVSAQEWQTDFDKAKELAGKQNQNILLVFSGSDWCAPCIKLDREIWKSEDFINYAKDSIVLLRADFPKKKDNKLSIEQQAKNDLLAEKYNQEGYFPKVLILNAEGKVLGTLGYENIPSKEYVGKIRKFDKKPKISLKVFQEKKLLMGSRFDFTVVAENEIIAKSYFDIAINEITRIEKLISSWDENSQTSDINRNAGIKPVIVDQELFELIERSLAISKLTDGAFDISYASMDKIWKYDGSMTQMPDVELVKKSAEKIGFEKIILNRENHSVFLQQEGMKIGFGAIGKGYAADKAKELLISKGVSAGIVNASGDMNTWGKQPDGKDWMIAITNPFDKNKSFGLVPLKHGAVVTSGDYEKFVMFDNVRYSHIINPKTGYPAKGIISVTVFAPSAELSDALATGVFVMGVETGLDRINQLPNVDCIIIDEKGNIHKSKNININEN